MFVNYVLIDASNFFSFFKFRPGSYFIIMSYTSDIQLKRLHYELDQLIHPHRPTTTCAVDVMLVILIIHNCHSHTMTHICTKNTALKHQPQEATKYIIHNPNNNPSPINS
jgi:hypothetical protein